jgi:hypothetical protein
MRVLVACEFSGMVRTAFRALGHDAWSCDLEPAEDESEFHICGDATEALKDSWDLLVAHPPCTYLTNAGHASMLPSIRQRQTRKVSGTHAMRRSQAAAFFNLKNAAVPRITIGTYHKVC